MIEKYFKNLITGVLVASFILIPFGSLPKKAEAQGIQAYTSGLVPAIAQLPLCRGKLTNSTRLLFGQASAAATIAELEKNGATVQEINELTNLNEEVTEQSVQLDAIRTYDPEANKKLIRLRLELNKKLETIQKSTTSLDESDTCLKSIGRLVIKMLLQKITLSTVNWINSGFDGKPAFIQDPGKFFGDIAKNEVLQFGLEINNPELFPFGRAWMQRQALAFNNHFADNARYSLNEMIEATSPGYSAQTFQADFSQGGWEAWSALTQVPANNPLGFQLMADNELQRRLAGTVQSNAQNVRDNLEQAGGFLGDNRCSQPQGLTRQQHEEGLARRSALGSGPNLATYRSQYGDRAQEFFDADLEEYQTKMNDTPICKAWEYVTPGKLIAEAATSTIKYPENNLLKAEDLNDAVAAILDALLSRFSADIMERGYANLGNEGADGSFVYNPNSRRADYPSQTEQDFNPIHLTTSWLQSNPDFNIRNDLTQALIDEQRTYVDKLKLQNKELNSTTDGKPYKMNPNTNRSNAYGLIPLIDQLDYCIPGPHPGWEGDSQRILDARTSVIIPETEQSVENKDKTALMSSVKAIVTTAGPAVYAAYGAALGSAVPVVGTIIGAAIGVALGFVVDLFTSDDNLEKVRSYYATHIGVLTGLRIRYDLDDAVAVGNIESKQGTVQALNVVLNRYIDMVRKVYDEQFLPSVTSEAETEFRKLKGYAQMISNNEEAITNSINVVNNLEEIKIIVDGLNAEYRPGGIFLSLEAEEEYETQLKAQIEVFGRLTTNMVNGSDIANADNMLKQIVDQQNHLVDLIKGPFGCEKDLELERQRLPAELYATKRMDYPFPIFYTYSMGPGTTIPDPWNSGYSNKTNTKANNTLGPGFLSYYLFQTDREDSSWENCGLTREWGDPGSNQTAVGEFSNSCQLKMVDIVPTSKLVTYSGVIGRSLGARPSTRTDCERQYGVLTQSIGVILETLTGDPGDWRSCVTGPWEFTIGVY